MAWEQKLHVSDVSICLFIFYLGRDAHSPKLVGHEFEKWCYTEVRAHHVAEVTEKARRLCEAFLPYLP